MINFELAREIYGMNPWFVDQTSLPSLLAIQKSFNAGITLETPDKKYNSPSFVKLTSDTRIIDRPYSDGWRPGQLDNNEEFTGVGVINIDGPITVGGGASTVGMRDLSALMLKMSLDRRIVSFVVVSDSGGGASGAVEVMGDTIRQINDKKPVYGLIKKGGMAASACYGILSFCREIYAESEMSIVGSAGTMIQFSGREANTTDPDGKKHIRLYASESTMKNKGFEDALNKDDYEVLVNDLLDPVNERFLDQIAKNRPALVGSDYRNGNTKFAKDAVGTFVDGIKNFTEVVELAVSSAEPIEQTAEEKSINNNSKTKNVMTKSELKQKHPELFQSVFNAGVEAEKDRAGAWMAHVGTDAEAVKAGIASGESISATKREEFLVKASSLSHVKNLNADSAKEIKSPEAGAKKDEPTEADAFYGDVDKKLGVTDKK